ncbi:hypothetical protein F2Q68_00008873 [Brassica cretica]|uniref:Uncharacterized protein n=2 Tax=Brassica TaxID=3705 RepID=A0A8S9KSS3_BRACR|nr:hypothetical protein F2Q68_00008873 [Brassica cretica]
MGKGGAINAEDGEGKRRTWRWPLATLVVVLFSVAVSSRTVSNVSFFFGDQLSCGVTAHSGETVECVIYVIVVCANVQRLSSLNPLKGPVFLHIIRFVKKENHKLLLTVLEKT